MLTAGSRRNDRAAANRSHFTLKLSVISPIQPTDGLPHKVQFAAAITSAVGPEGKLL